MFKKTIAIIATLLITMSFLVGCGGSGETKKEKITLKMSVTSAESSTWTKGAQKFADTVKEKTKGQVEIKVYPNEQLSGGNQGKGVEMLRTGAIDLSFHSNIIYSIMDEKFAVISMPWLLPDFKTVDEKLAGKGGEAINKLLLEKGIVGLGFGENGYRQLTNSKKEIKTLDDMKAMKIRIPGMKMYITLFKALGADPITMNFAEVFTALQQKAIDGEENPLDIINSSKINEVQKYMTMWNYSYDAIILGMNKAKFDTLDKDTQKIIQDAAKEACAYQVKLNRDANDSHTKNFKDKGMVITELTAEQMQTFKDAVKSVYTEYEPILGKDLLDAFK